MMLVASRVGAADSGPVVSFAPMKPVFITFEGLDGSGKSSHLQALTQALQDISLDHLLTKEPGGTPLADAIRSVFLDPQWESVEGTVELLLVFASRRQHLIERIDPALARGEIVLCDRFTDSTYAYQGFGRGVSLDQIATVDELATGARRPDRTLLFDLPAAVAWDRGQSSQRRSLPVELGGVDRIDGEGLDFYQRVREGFLELASADSERFRVVDSSGSKPETARQVVEVLRDLLPKEALDAVSWVED